MNENNLMMIVFILIIIVMLLIIIVVLVNKKSSSINQKEETIKKNRAFPVEMPSTIGVFFPQQIESFSSSQLVDIARKIYSSYKIFDYKNMDSNELDKKEWHSWQVSMLLMLFKKGEDFFIPNQEEIFHSVFLNSSENDIKSLMRTVLNKYKNNVDINAVKDKMCKEYIWSNRDVSIIFYFLTNYKNYSK